MDLKQLLYFVTIVEEGNISAAAQKLFLSQPPLSHQMKLLENELHCTLFERGSRSIHLTDEGRILYRRAIDILRMSDIAKEEILSFSEKEQGIIRLGIVSSVASSYGAQWISAFSKKYPHISFEIYEANTYELLDMLKENVIHFAFLRSPYPDREYTRLKLAREPLIAIAAPSKIGEVTEISIKELSALPLIIFRRWEHFITKEFQQYNLPFHYLCICDDARTTASLAENGMGIGLVPKSTLEFVHNDSLICAPITDCSILSDIELIYSPGTYLPNCCRLFWDFMSQTHDSLHIS